MDLDLEHSHQIQHAFYLNEFKFCLTYINSFKSKVILFR